MIRTGKKMTRHPRTQRRTTPLPVPGGTQDAPRSGPARDLAAFARHEGGAVAIIAGIALPVLLGFAGLALEYGQILAVRAEAQRTADFAAHAGAVAYVRTGGTGPMTDAARGVARLNGFGADEIVVELDTTAPGGADMAVRATITKPKRLYLPQFVGGGTSVDVVTSAVAGTTGGDPACIQALDADGSGVTMSGGTTLRADECGVASNAEVAAPCGTQIITSSLSYNSGSDPLENNCGGGDPIIDPDGNPPKVSREPTTDPLAGMAALGTAVTQMTDTASLSAPSGATSSTVPSGPDIHFAYNETFQQGTP